MRISKELARAELERRKRLVADNDRLRRELYALKEKHERFVNVAMAGVNYRHMAALADAELDQMILEEDDE